jgi:LuxR family transcriptional regulator, quorum-sensing system regulator CciR
MLTAQTQSLVAAVGDADNFAALHAALETATAAFGFRNFVLTQHLFPHRWAELRIALHNCPASWVAAYVEKRLYRCDPILLATWRTPLGFLWDDLPGLVTVTKERQHVLDLFREAGVGNGITIPIHVPGEPSGSCTFATTRDQRFPMDRLIDAQVFGAFAYQAARRIAGLDGRRHPSHKPLTPRQRDCLLWATRGKTDWEIGQILALSPDTVAQHIELARLRYGVSKRMQLAVRAIYLGDISLAEAVGDTPFLT